MAITWGSEISKSTSALKLGYEASTNGQTTTVKVYVWTKFGIQDSVNTFIVDFCGTSGKYNGSIGINTSGSSNAWATSRQQLLWTGTTTNQTWSVNASLTGVESVGKSNKAWLGYKSGTAWSSIGKPGAINIKQNSDLSITISGTWPSNGTNNPVKYCDLYYKWNSSTAAWNDSNKYVKIGASSNGNYSYTIPTSDVLNGTHTSIAVRVYGICTYGNNTGTDVKTSTVVQGGIITKVPWRYYFSDSSNDGFREDFSDNYIEWTKNVGEVFQVAIYQPNIRRWKSIYWGEGDIVKDSNGNDTGKRKIDLNKNKSARREALSCMTNSNCGYWYYNSSNPSAQHPYPSARFYDSTLVLESYKIVNYKTDYSKYNDKYTDFISNSTETMRIELSCPRTIPSNFKISPIEEEDFSYSSNNFNITWNPVDWANQYVIRYALESPITKNSWYQCKEDIIVKGDETIEGHDITSYIVSIPSALAGQKIRFTLKARWHGEADGLSYDYDGPETSIVELQKQGGMVTFINNKYQNCHVCVVDNNGKLVKALATYVYAYKDGSTTEKEWRLIKMNS